MSRMRKEKTGGRRDGKKVKDEGIKGRTEMGGEGGKREGREGGRGNGRNPTKPKILATSLDSYALLRGPSPMFLPEGPVVSLAATDARQSSAAVHSTTTTTY